jgi:hypothetical protein
MLENYDFTKLSPASAGCILSYLLESDAARFAPAGCERDISWIGPFLFAL